VLTRQEKEKLVIELYNQGKTIRDIAKELRLSFRDIGTILRRASGEIEEKQDKEQSSLLSPSTQAYRLFSEGKTPIEAAIELDLSESEISKFYEEYLNLDQMHDLKMVHDEIGSNIVHFLQLYRLSKKERMNPQHIVSLLKIASNDLSELERRYHRLKRDTVLLDLEKQKSEQIGSQVRILAKMSEDYKQQIEKLHKKKIALEDLIEEYEKNEVSKKIRRIAEEEVNNTLTKSKDLLVLAISSVLESISKDPAKYNFLINSNQHNDDKWHTPHPNFIDMYRSLILEDSQKLFEVMVRELINKTIESTILKLGPQPF
jgi:transcriptional regulator